MKNIIQKISANKLNLGLITLVIVLIIGGFFGIVKFIAPQNEDALEEVDLIFDAEGPYALLLPRRDGNALVLNLKRTSSYDEISYELAYTSLVEEVVVGDSKKKLNFSEGEEGEGGVIDRGVVGNINVEAKKGEYEQEILLGTCSKNVCKYDKGVENGTLTLHIRKGRQAFRMVTQWRLQKPDVALGVLSSGDEHFKFTTAAKREDLALVGYSVVNDLTGAPKLPEGKQVLGKVYGLNVPLTRDLPPGVVTYELAENPPQGSKLARYDEGQNRWIEMETKIEGSKLEAQADGSGIFAVLIPKK